MAPRNKKQTEKRKPVMLDEKTHADLCSYAGSQQKALKIVLKDLIYTNAKMQRFLNKSTQTTQHSENHLSTTL